MIKALTFTFIFISGVLLLSNCEQENANPRSYPRVTTLSVTNISEKGASFRAELYSLGTEKIIDHGFVWGTSDQTMTYSDRIKMGPCDSTGTFQVNVTTSLRKDFKYIVKPFIQTADHIVYGAPVAFKSLGSQAPVISGFEPKAATWIDTLTIRGKHFSWIRGENEVKLNQITCTAVSSTDTTIQVLVASELADLKAILSVDMAGNVATFTADTFHLLIPVIQDFFPKQVRWGDTIIVTGTRFMSDRLVPFLSVSLGGFSCNIIEKKKESFKFLVPPDLATQSNVLIIKMMNQNYTIPEKVSLLPPLISGIRPKVGTWGTEVTLKGKFHPMALRNVITIGGYSASIVSNDKDSIRVKIPQNLNTARNVFLDNSSPFSVVSIDTFKLFGPVIESITPLTGTINTNVTIKGKYLQNPSGLTTVKFGSITASLLGHSQTQLDCSVPAGLINGPTNISVTVSSQTNINQTPFIINNPIITRVYPLSGVAGDQITIEGENLSVQSLYPDVYFSSNSIDIFASTVSNTTNKIVVTVPVDVDSIPKKLKLNFRSNSFAVYSSESFILNPPVITSVDAGVLIPGNDVTINGNNFSSSFINNQIFWGKYPLKLKSPGPNVIIATVPNNIPRGFNKISIITGGYRRTYPALFENRGAWAEITLPPALNWSSSANSGLGFSLKGLGYIIDIAGNMSSYNPITKAFGDLGVHQEFKPIEFSRAILNDTLYAIGYNYGTLTGLYRYDTGTNLWVYIAPAPSNYTAGIAFSLNGKLYYGLTIFQDNYNVTRNIWVFEPGTKTWIPKNQSPFFSFQRAVAYFTIDNRGYVLYMDKTFVEYNPDTDTWTKLASYPGPGNNTKGLAFFVLNNKGYVGLGRSDIYPTPPEYNDFWSYDPLTGSWSTAYSIPNLGRYNSTWFVIDNKAYIGFGAKNTNQAIRDFYEFDPNFPL